MFLVVAGCGSDTDDTSDRPTEPAVSSTTSPSAPESASVSPDARYGTVDELRDAAVAAGYECRRWKVDNKVTLAAESGSCSADDVFATFASDGDLQAQLDSFKGTDDMLAEAGIEPDPHLVGPNWIITGPDAGGLQSALGGTVVTPSLS
jgi:hypothetical protein